MDKITQIIQFAVLIVGSLALVAGFLIAAYIYYIQSGQEEGE